MLTLKEYIAEAADPAKKKAVEHVKWHASVFRDDHNVAPSTDKHWHEVYHNARVDWADENKDDPDHAAVAAHLKRMHEAKIDPKKHKRLTKAIGVQPMKEEVLEEGTNDVHKGLKSLGMKETTHHGLEYYERKYSGNHKLADVHKHFKSNGWTKTSDHDVYGHHTTTIYHPAGTGPRENPHAQVHHKDGKVFHIHFEYRQPND